MGNNIIIAGITIKQKIASMQSGNFWYFISSLFYCKGSVYYGVVIIIGMLFINEFMLFATTSTNKLFHLILSTLNLYQKTSETIVNTHICGCFVINLCLTKKRKK